MDSRLINVIVLGLAFMILFTAFDATGTVEQSVLEGVKNESINETNFEGSGYISLAVVYIVFGVANVFSPVVLSILGPSISMFVGGITYLLYTLSFITLMMWSLYLASILLGIGGAVVWVARGAYFASISDEMTVSRNTGVFWAIFQVCSLPGSLYMYLSVTTEMITRSTRYRLFAVFSIVSAVGLAFFALIIWRTLIERRRSNSQQSNTKTKVTLANIIETLKIAFRLLKTRNMLLLLIPFAYTGLSQTLFQTVYATCIGHFIKYGGTRKRLIGLHGVLLGIGEILGSGLFGFITKPKTPSQRALIIFIGFVLQIIFYYSVFVNFPSDAPAKETASKSYFEFNSSISQIIAFVGSVLVGLGDSSISTQLMSVLASRYKDTSASAFAIYQLIQGLASAIGFFYAATLGLEYQLLIVVVGLFLSTLAFFIVLFDDSDMNLNTSSKFVRAPMN